MRRGPLPDDPLAAGLFPTLPAEVRWGLGRTQRLLVGLGHPLRLIPVLHVGGTNGKGSVARVWASILQASGLRVGLYTSPELFSFRERILIDGRPLSDARLEAYAAELRPLLLRERPTFFEAATALAFLAMGRADVEVAVVEVGLGGRLDATNVVTPVVTAVTNVSMDHAEMLGGDVATIAREKAGIMKPGVPVYTAAEDPDVLATLTREAATLGAPLVRVPQPRSESTADGTRLRVRTRRWGTLDLLSPLVGRHQASNVALAVRSLDSLPPRIPVSVESIQEGVAAARPAGRFQVELDDRGRRWILDVAHNPAAVAALAATLEVVDVPRPRVGVVGILADKAHAEMLDVLASALDQVLLTVPPSIDPSRRWDPEAARNGVLEASGGASSSSLRARLQVEPDPTRALDRGREVAGEGGTVVVTGSSALVAHGLRSLDRVPSEALPLSSDSG